MGVLGGAIRRDRGSFRGDLEARCSSRASVRRVLLGCESCGFRDVFLKDLYAFVDLEEACS